MTVKRTQEHPNNYTYRLFNLHPISHTVQIYAMSSETPTTAQSILFLPNRLHSADAHSVLDAFRTNNEDSNSDNESADDHPPPSPTGSYLSVMPPGHILPSELRLHCLVRAPRATGTNSFTQTAQYVRNLPEAYRLRRVLRSYSLWDNCKAYADHLDQGLTTWSTRDEQAHDLPSRDQQTRAVHRLNSWFITHSQGHTISVNCEAAIQDEVVKQLLDPLNMLLEVRISMVHSMGIESYFKITLDSI